MRLVEDPAGLLQPHEKTRAAARGLGGHPLRAREAPGAIAEMLGAEQLAADRAREELLGRNGGSGEQARQAGRGQTGSDRSGLAADVQRAQLVGNEMSANTGTRNLAGHGGEALVLGGVRRVTAMAQYAR